MHTKPTSTVTSRDRIVLFDGVCNLCNGFVQFIIERDPHARFTFGALQSDAARELLANTLVHPEELRTVVYLRKGKVLVRSTAALNILKDLGGAWKLLYALIIIPAPLRDLVYRWISNKRYAWFGRKDACMIPTPELRARFL